MISNRKVRVFYTIVVLWTVVSLIFSPQVSGEIFQYEALAQTAGVWFIVCSAPALPVFWIWILERSPWNRWFTIPVLLLGLFVTVIFLGESNLDDFWFIPSGWWVIACFVAWILKGATRIDAVSGV